MPSPPVSHVAFEKLTPIASLRGLSAALAHSLGEQGVSGSEMATLLAEAVEAECISCRITVSGADLITTGLHTHVAAANEKLDRLRLGYCCRRDCPSLYYLVRFAPRPGVEWRELWERAEPGFAQAAEPAPDRNLTARILWRNPIPAEWIEQGRRPFVLGAVFLFVLLLLFIGGCRFGLSPKSRVFIVAGLAPVPVDVSVRQEPSRHYSHELGP